MLGQSMAITLPTITRTGIFPEVLVPFKLYPAIVVTEDDLEDDISA